MTRLALDHVVLAVPDLALGCARFADTTGCRPIDGGPHGTLGTRNALVAFDGERYLELIGPDPDTRGETNLGGRLAEQVGDQLLAWAIRADDLEPLRAEALRQDLAPSTLLSVERMRPDGARLAWQMVGLVGRGGAWPFFIDWRGAPHPSADAPRVGALLDFEARLPVEDTGALLFARTSGARLVEGPPGLRVAFESPRGEVAWSVDDPLGFFG